MVVGSSEQAARYIAKKILFKMGPIFVGPALFYNILKIHITHPIKKNLFKYR
jgi:hypothetical protein